MWLSQLCSHGTTYTVLTTAQSEGSQDQSSSRNDSMRLNSTSGLLVVYIYIRCNMLQCYLARLSALQCYNMCHNGHRIILYSVLVILMDNVHAGGILTRGLSVLVHRLHVKLNVKCLYHGCILLGKTWPSSKCIVLKVYHTQHTFKHMLCWR